MNCQQARPLIDPYADGELEAVAILELEQHIEDCSACALAWRELQELKKALKNDAFYFSSPRQLRDSIRAELPQPAKLISPAFGWHWNWLTSALSGAAAICLALLIAVTVTRPSTGEQLASEIVSSHIRSLMANHVVDVVSSDQHTVKPWFSGKLDFSPPVKDLAAKEFLLVGGRLDYVAGHNVAALIFQRHKHVINLFIWPAKSADSSPILNSSSQGYRLVRWANAGMEFWAVSDLNEKELLEFANDFAAN